MFVVLALLGTLVITTFAACLARRHGHGLLVGVFVGAVLISVVVAGKLVNVFGFTVSAALLLYSATFLLTDTLSEFFGKRFAFRAVAAGLIGDILLVYTVKMAIMWEPSPYWEGQEAFVATLGSTWRIVLGSFLAYAAAQFHDVIAYDFWKRKMGGRHMWWRNNASTWVSQAVDTVIFYSVAFYGTVPNGILIRDLILVTFVIKIVIAAADTPFLYFIRWYYRRAPIAEPAYETSDVERVTSSVKS
ncbi:MAG: queuosine precursor transporter [Deltaproteobacteria bacterium]|nr:queuosine precursor transporter [Deltaproteobacteria bacterium]